MVGGAAVANCTAAFLVGGHWREKKEWEKCRKDPWKKGIILVGLTWDSIIWTRQKIDISNTHLVGIADTTGWGCWDSQSQYIFL